jgi:hypothetical protein
VRICTICESSGYKKKDTLFIDTADIPAADEYSFIFVLDFMVSPFEGDDLGVEEHG